MDKEELDSWLERAKKFKHEDYPTTELDDKTKKIEKVKGKYVGMTDSSVGISGGAIEGKSQPKNFSMPKVKIKSPNGTITTVPLDTFVKHHESKKK